MKEAGEELSPQSLCNTLEYEDVQSRMTQSRVHLY